MLILILTVPCLRPGQPVDRIRNTRRRSWWETSKTVGEKRLKGDPEQVRVHDFVIPELGRVTPYGVYECGQEPRLGERGY